MSTIVPVSAGSPIYFRVENPAAWLSLSAGGEMRVAGWFFDAQGRPAREVRVRLGDRVVKAVFVPRPEVAAANPLVFTQSAQVRPPAIGFYATFATRPGWKFLRVEAEDAQGRVWPLGTRLVYVRGGGEQPNYYADWVRFYDSPDETDYAAMRQQSESWPNPPQFSVIVVAANAPQNFRRDSIESVRTQIYPHYDLDMAASGEAAALQPQTVPHEFVVLLEAGGKLRPHALFAVAAALQTSPQAALLYADDDEITPAGERRQPYFKPDWNPALLLGQNYLGNFIAFRRELLPQLGQLPGGLTNAPVWEVALRLSTLVQASAVVHLPFVLCHRQISSASHPSIIEKHLRANGVPASVESIGGFPRIKFPLAQPAPRASLLMPSACNLQFLAPCLKGLLEQTRYPDFEILLAVNAIRDTIPAQRDFLKKIADDPRVRVLRYPDRPFNISWIINWAERHATGSILGCLNDDLEIIHEDWLQQMAGSLRQAGVGAAGPMLYYPDNTIQHAGMVLGVGGMAEHACRGLPRGASGYFGRAALAQDVSSVTGACLLVRREIFQQLGGFRESLPVNFNDVDFCLRVWEAGWRIIWTPAAELYHHESVSLGSDAAPQRAEANALEAAWMRERWAERLKVDPYYNPNLSLQRRQEWQPAFPPRLTRPWPIS